MRWRSRESSKRNPNHLDKIPRNGSMRSPRMIIRHSFRSRLQREPSLANQRKSAADDWLERRSPYSPATDPCLRSSTALTATTFLSRTASGVAACCSIFDGAALRGRSGSTTPARSRTRATALRCLGLLRQVIPFASSTSQIRRTYLPASYSRTRERPEGRLRVMRSATSEPKRWSWSTNKSHIERLL